MTSTTPKFGEGERAVPAALATALIPGGERMPSGQEAGVTERWIDRVLVARPDLHAPLERVINLAREMGGHPDPERLRRVDPAGSPFSPLPTHSVTRRKGREFREPTS